MKIKLVAFGIARDILGGSTSDILLSNGRTIDDLKKQLLANHADFEKLSTLSFAVNEEYQSDDFVLNNEDEVALLPPYAGG